MRGDSIICAVSPTVPRTLVPEILDSLPPDDPAALRSRRDLRLINVLMGNQRWASRAIQAHLDSNASVVEVGAGEGQLCQRLQVAGYRVTGCDLAPRPAELAVSIDWRQGDLFAELPALSANAIVARAR